MTEDDDYLSDTFLVPAVDPEVHSSYARKRQLAQIKADERGRVKSRKQREEEARNEGLQKRVGEEHGGGVNKGLSMLMKMGYRAGEGLGKIDAVGSKAGVEGAGEERMGLGVKRKIDEEAHSFKKPRIDPIPINIRTGRAGISSSSSKQSSSNSAQLPETSTYRSSKVSALEEKRALLSLEKARRTLIELDERNDIKESVYWTPVENNEMDERRARWAQRRLRMGDVDRDDEDQSPLGYPSGLSETVVDLEDDHTLVRKNEEEEWKALSVVKRLEKTVSYLREQHLYCFWCGAVYKDEKELYKFCPGPTEEDHE